MKKYILGLALFFAISNTASAQMKYGHIDADEILESMPEYAQLKATMQRKQKEQETKVTAMYTDFQKRQMELEQLGPALMAAIAEEKKLELDSLQRAIVAYQEAVGADLERLRDKLIKPLNDKYRKVVDIVAKENGYTLIFDQSTGIVVYGNENTNVTNLVKKKMGIN